jgi:hypothetical protein
MSSSPGPRVAALTFTPDGGDRETRITVSGKVGHGGEVLADREFWADLLSAL